MLVDKRDKALLDNLQLVGRVIKQGVESVTLTPHTDILKIFKKIRISLLNPGAGFLRIFTVAFDFILG